MKQIKSVVNDLSRNWLLNAVLSFALALLAVAVLFTNQYDIYALKRLIYVFPLAVLFYGGVAICFNRFIKPFWQKLAAYQKWQLFMISVIITAGILWLKPLPLPDVEQEHQLILNATGQKREPAKDSLVEIRSIRYLNGRNVADSDIIKTPDWLQSGEIYYSKGAPDSHFEIKGNMPGGLLLDLRYFNEGGQVVLTWDGVAQELDLYRSESATAPLVYRGINLLSMQPGAAFIVILTALLYCLGLLGAVSGLLVVLNILLRKHFSRTLYFVLLLILLAIFSMNKMNYLKIDMGRTFRDSTSYVEVADKALFSSDFWVGTRPFTLPLFLKLVGTTLSNFDSPEQLQRIALFQVALSIVCWAILGLSLMRAVRPRWLKLLFLALTLAFALSPEISIWDSLLLSESLSFSLFALMLAGWVELLADTQLRTKRKLWGICLLLSLLVTVLYAFIRDSNVYFALAGAVILWLACWLVTQIKPLKAGMGFYALAVIAIVVVQNLSLSGGDRWQIFIYDHLAMRILRNPAAVEYFENRGLPVSETLMQTTKMVGFEYQKLLIESPEMQSVRDWVECCGKSTYAGYLLSNPWQTLIEPLQNYSRLLNGDNLEYRNPRYDVRPLPVHLAEFNDLFFNHEVVMLVFLIIVEVSSLIMLFYRQRQPLWIVLAVLIVSVYPMMFLIWHAEPLEIERHAAQIGVQFRLAGWISLVLLLTEILRWIQHRINPGMYKILPLDD